MNPPRYVVVKATDSETFAQKLNEAAGQGYRVESFQLAQVLADGADVAYSVYAAVMEYEHPAG